MSCETYVNILNEFAASLFLRFKALALYSFPCQPDEFMMIRLIQS